MDSGWRLSRADGTGAGDALGRLVLRPYKTRMGPGKPIRIEYSDGTFVPMDGPLRPPLEIVMDLVRSHPGAAQKDLIALAGKQGLGQHRLVETLDAAVLAGSIHTRWGQRKTFCYYPPETTFRGVL